MISARIATMLRAAGCALALVVTTLITEVTAHGDTPAFAKFKNEMMPKVGQKITVVGNLHDGKDGFWLAFNNWGVYIRSVKESGLSRENDLYVRFPPKGQTVKVIGVLRYFPQPAGTGNDKYGRAVQTSPEHFFFDAATVRMSLWSPQVTSRKATEEEFQFLVFDAKRSSSAQRDWLKQHEVIFDRADYCNLMKSFRDVGPSSAGSGAIEFARFLVLRDVDSYDSASHTFHDELSGVDVDVSFEFPSGEPRSQWNKKGSPPAVVMSLSVHRGQSDTQGDTERSEVMFVRGKTRTYLQLIKLARVGETEYRYSLSCSDPREKLRFLERVLDSRGKR